MRRVGICITIAVDESAGVALARQLGQDGYDVSVYDPVAHAGARALEGLAEGVESVEALLERSDVVVIATPWREFADLPLDSLSREGDPLVVIDCWRLLSEEDYGDAVEIVRLGRGLEETSPV